MLENCFAERISPFRRGHLDVPMLDFNGTDETQIHGNTITLLVHNAKLVDEVAIKMFGTGSCCWCHLVGQFIAPAGRESRSRRRVTLLCGDCRKYLYWGAPTQEMVLVGGKGNIAKWTEGERTVMCMADIVV